MKREKVLAYAIGVALGCLILLAIPRREKSEPARHPWHAQTAPEGTYPMRFTDDMGRTVTFERQPRHFISLAPSVTEILFAMDMGDHLVAVTQWCTYPEAARRLRDSGAQVGSIDQPNREAIAAYRPDLVLGTDLTPPEVYAVLQNPPRTVAVALRHDSMDDVIEDVKAIGRITGVPGRALGLIHRLKAERAAVEERLARVAAQPRQRVLFLLSIEAGARPGWAPGRGTWVGSLIEAAHGENVAAALGLAWGEVSMEALVALNPSVILVRDGETPEQQARLLAEIENLPAHPVWRQVRAVQDGRVHLVPHAPLNIPGPRIMQAFSAIAERLWPLDE